jgi:hypothetical protein
LFVESHARAQVTRGVAWLAGIAAIALLVSFQWEVWLAVPLLFAILILGVGLSGHLVAGERNGSFWLFNHRLWLAAALALLGAGMFGAGLSVIVLTLNFLFGLDLPATLHRDINTVAFGFIAPVSWLALAPRSFTDQLGEQEEREFTTRAVAALVKFVLVPLLLSTPPSSTPTPSRSDLKAHCPRARSARWWSAIYWSAPQLWCSPIQPATAAACSCACSGAFGSGWR